MEIVLPETVFLASFIDVFTVLPKSLRMSSLASIDLHNNVKAICGLKNILINLSHQVFFYESRHSN